MRRWELPLPLEHDGPVPLAVQIARGLAEQIRRGLLARGSVLPGSRTLASALGVSRNTVYAAYEELKAEGWITGSRARGSFVSEEAGAKAAAASSPRPRGSVDTRRRPGFPLPAFVGPPAQLTPPPTLPGALHWDFGVPDVRLAPAEPLARAFRRVLKHRRSRALDYARYTGDGPSPLAAPLAEMLASTRALRVGPEDLLITRGSQMGLYLLAQAVLAPGDVVAVEDPGYFSAWDVFRARGARVLPLPTDAQGLRVDLLESRLRHERVAAVFVTPHHQFPTTATLSAARRIQLLALARRRRFVVIEDDFDHELHYDGPPVLPLASADGASVVLYVGSVSKIFAPGLRLGYVAAPAQVLERLRYHRSLIELQGDLGLELALAELFEDGEILRHLNRARRIYRTRRNHLLELLGRHLGGVLEVTPPRGGMALWAKTAPGLDPAVWSARARERGLAFRTGGVFYFRPREQPFVRLGFARLDEAELTEAVRRLVAALPTSRTARRRR